MIGLSPLADQLWQRGRLPELPVIDMHGHMGEFGPIYFPRASAQAMIGSMDECGVRLLVFSHHAALFSPAEGNLASLAAVQQFPDRLRAYAVVNPNYPESALSAIRLVAEHPGAFVGFKFLSDYHRQPLEAGAYRPAWEYADAHRLLVLAHTWGGSPYDGAGQVRWAAERYAGIKFLLGHSLHGDWQAAVGLARQFSQLYLELTAVFDDRGVIEKFAGEVGSDRMLFGTDLPWFDPHHALGALLSAQISDADRHNICHLNAERLLGLSS
jgi:predicted TIM-barrel fold metal-dependent hydrolase